MIYSSPSPCCLYKLPCLDLVFAGVIKLREGPPGLGWALYHHWCYHMRDRKICCTETQRKHREGGHVVKKAVIGVMQLQAK